MSWTRPFPLKRFLPVNKCTFIFLISIDLGVQMSKNQYKQEFEEFSLRFDRQLSLTPMFWATKDEKVRGILFGTNESNNKGDSKLNHLLHIHFARPQRVERIDCGTLKQTWLAILFTLTKPAENNLFCASAIFVVQVSHSTNHVVLRCCMNFNFNLQPKTRLASWFDTSLQTA